jgi:cysteine-rich repeat protein
MCLFEATCGNGTVEPGEECDDGGVLGGDGCDMACQLEAGTLCGDAVDLNTAGTTVGSVTSYLGDTTGSLVMNVGNPSCSLGTTGIPSILHSYTTTARSSLVIESLDVGSALNDTVVWAYLDCQDTSAAGELTCDDDSGPAFYSLATTAILPPGTSVFIVISGYDAIHVGPYSLQITEIPVIPDGDPCDPADPAQQCEDNSSCEGPPGGETCQPPVCGDGVIEGVEECDDANTMDGDGCSSACIVEVTLESEPNNTFATANGPFTPDTGLIGAAIGMIGDQDFFAINLPATADLRIETFDPSGPNTCAGGVDTVIELLAPDGATSIITRDQGGVNNCSRINSTLAADAAARHLAPGIYFVRVEDYLNNGIIAGYTLYVTYNALCGDGVVEGAEECEPGGATPCQATCDRVQVCGDGFLDAPEACDDSNMTNGDGCSSTCALEPQAESEPNDIFMTADPAFPGAISAAITVAGDNDFFAVTVPGPASILTATLTAGVVNTCGSSVNPAPPAIDSEIQILGTNGTTSLATNDDINGSTNYCSSAQATGLAAGTYFIRTSGSAAYCPNCTYDYTLNITVN